MMKGTVKLFNKIEIETINKCNNTCGFCPANKMQDIRKHTQMPMQLFKKIILELTNLRYEGALGLFSNNEPLLDTLLFERVQFARKQLPNAFLYIYTNGISLTSRKLLALLQHVDFIHINNYNTVPQLLPRHQEFQKTLIKYSIPKSKAEIHLRNISEALSTRGGQSPNREKAATIKSPCILPFSQMVIRPNGKVSFCCNDVYGTFTMGDVSEQSLMDIWHGRFFETSRANMLKGRSYQKPCMNCDMLFMPLACE